MAVYFAEMMIDFNDDSGYIHTCLKPVESDYSEPVETDSFKFSLVLDMDQSGRLLGIEITRVDQALPEKYIRETASMNVSSQVPFFVHEKEDYAMLVLDDQNEAESRYEYDNLEISLDDRKRLISIRIADIRKRLQKDFFK